MSSIRRWISAAAVTLCVGSFAAQFAWGQETRAHTQANDQARIVLSQSLPGLDGDHLKAVLVEVNYGPGETSLPHSHPCAVIGYVVEGCSAPR